MHLATTPYEPYGIKREKDRDLHLDIVYFSGGAIIVMASLCALRTWRSLKKKHSPVGLNETSLSVPEVGGRPRRKPWRFWSFFSRNYDRVSRRQKRHITNEISSQLMSLGNPNMGEICHSANTGSQKTQTLSPDTHNNPTTARPQTLMFEKRKPRKGPMVKSYSHDEYQNLRVSSNRKFRENALTRPYSVGIATNLPQFAVVKNKKRSGYHWPICGGKPGLKRSASTEILPMHVMAPFRPAISEMRSARVGKYLSIPSGLNYLGPFPLDSPLQPIKFPNYINHPPPIPLSKIPKQSIRPPLQDFSNAPPAYQIGRLPEESRFIRSPKPHAFIRHYFSEVKGESPKQIFLRMSTETSSSEIPSRAAYVAHYQNDLRNKGQDRELHWTEEPCNKTSNQEIKSPKSRDSVHIMGSRNETNPSTTQIADNVNHGGISTFRAKSKLQNYKWPQSFDQGFLETARERRTGMGQEPPFKNSKFTSQVQVHLSATSPLIKEDEELEIDMPSDLLLQTTSLQIDGKSAIKSQNIKKISDDATKHDKEVKFVNKEIAPKQSETRYHHSPIHKENLSQVNLQSPDSVKSHTITLI